MLAAHGLEVPAEREAQLAALEEHGLAWEVADAATLAELAATFERVDGSGRGVLLTRDHAGLNEVQDSRACGWIRALHAAGDKLWAWIELTPYGHTMVDGGEFVYFSTEYDYREFERTSAGASPRRLSGCTLTNMPRHAEQTPCTNMQTPPPAAARCSGGASEGKETQKEKMDTEPNKKEDTAATTEEDESQKTQENCDDTGTTKEGAAEAGTTEGGQTDNAEGGNAGGDEDNQASNSDTTGESMDLEAAAVGMAEALELPETATPADLLEAVKAAVRSNEELRAALAEANKASGTGTEGVAGNSRRYPHLTSRNSAKPGAPLRGKKPNGTVTVMVGGRPMAVNSQDKSRADYCAKAIQRAERELGRKMTASEYTTAYRKANADYNAGVNR